MALDQLTKYISDYRIERCKALNNERRMPWFASASSSIPALLTDVCSTKEANSQWERVYLQGDKSAVNDRLKLSGYRMEVAFVAGCRRDLRILFAAGDDNRPRTSLDWDRFEYQRLILNNTLMDLMVKNIKNEQKGI